MSEERLARIETKLDQLAEAMITMARMEERMVTLFKRMDRYDEEQSEMQTKLSHLEKNSIRRGTVEGLFEKAFWLIGGGLLTWFLKR